MSFKKFIFCISFLGSAVCFAQEQDTINEYELETVKIIKEKVKTITGAGQYIDAKKLQKLNQTNINNVLRIIPGVNIRDEEGFGLRPNIGLRGTPVNRSAKISLMEDGILAAPAPYSDPSAYYFPTFARIQGVEVLKGSSQIKYGPYTIGGAINLISTQIPNEFRGFAQLSTGSFNTNQQRIWIGDSKKNIDYLFEFNRIASNGFKQMENGANTGFDRRDVLGKLRWHTSKTAKISQSVLLKVGNTFEDSKETYLGLTLDDYNNNSRRRYLGTQRDLLDLRQEQISITHNINPFDKFYVTTSGYYTKVFRDWARANTFGGQSINNILADPSANQTAYNIMTGVANGNISYQSAARTYYTKGIQTALNYQFDTGQIKNKIELGIRFHEDQADRFGTTSTYAMTNGIMILTNAGVKGNQENQIRNAKSLASYITYEINYKNLKLSPGVRYEKIQLDFENYGNADNARLGTNLRKAKNELSTVLPGIGMNYSINTSMNIFGGVHKGFSPPGMPSVTSTVGQAKIEKSLNYELGYRIEKRYVIGQIGGFINDYSNILGSDNISGGGAGTGDLFNAGNAKIKGIEASIDINIADALKINNPNIKLPLNIAYTHTNAKFQDTFVNGGGDWGSGTINKGDFIPFITPNLLTCSLGFENKKFNTTLTGRYTGTTRIKPGQSDEVVPQNGILYNNVTAIDGFLIIDLSSNYILTKNLTIFTLFNNVTNNKSIVANLPQGYRPNLPLSYNLGLKFNL
ncbi:TonB-dependent receptor [Flavobacterium sp. F-328]|uniref:TonB-dependent receptor n=1 Tax=Flavobacterium erciyesense TaxID=2825842 RepID=A0ABS5D2S7_9FLAO|nr:TonB-dependent receptor [Flavobacterium erciyesense]MBQ0908336.1 TonB-dependent receptor [Flavobacterium erciyesense]